MRICENGRRRGYQLLFQFIDLVYRKTVQNLIKMDMRN